MTLAKISLADLTQRKGFGAAMVASMKARMPRSRSSIGRCTLRWGARGQQGEPALDLVDPRGRGRREVDVPARLLGQPVPDQLGLGPVTAKLCRLAI